MPQATTRNEIRPDHNSLVYRIHAVTEPAAGWASALDLLRQHFSARCAVLGHHDFRGGNGCTLCVAPGNDEFAASCARYAPRNPWFLSSVDYRCGRVMIGSELIGRRELVRTDFYRGVLKPHGLLHRLSAVVARHGEVAYYVDLHRGEHQAPFGNQERAGLKELLPHLQLALGNWWRYRQADDLATIMGRMLDQTGHATLLVAADGRIVRRSNSEANWTDPAIGLQVRDNVVYATSPADTRALREAISEVTRADVAPERSVSRVVAIALPGASHQVMITVRCAGEAFFAANGRRCRLAALTVRYSGSDHDPQDCALARRYELTPAQAKVSALVFSGHSIARVAELLGVSENTVRSHLKQIFQKTHTHGQMELVHFHAQMCTGKG